MADVDYTYTAIQSGGIRRDGTNNSITADYYQLGRWVGASTAGYMGVRFTIPAAIAAGDISSVTLRIASRQTGILETGLRVEEDDAAAFATSGGRRVDTLWTAIGGTNEVYWRLAETSAGTYYESPDLSTGVEAAITEHGAGDITIAVIGDGGTPTDSGYPTHQWHAVGSAYEPELVVTLSVTPNSEEVTTTAPGVTGTVAEPAVYEKLNDISYHLTGYGDDTRRVLDIYKPGSDAPAGGWPIVMFTHGGGFIAGSEESDVTTSIVHDVLSSGCVLLSVRYKLIAYNYFLQTNTGWTRPHLVQDLLCAAQWATTTGASTYDLSEDVLIFAGYSAGGHIALEAALVSIDSGADGYTIDYRGLNTPEGDRYDDYPSLDQTGGLPSIPAAKGYFGFAPPVRLGRVSELNTLIEPNIASYFGGNPQATGIRYAAVDHEGDLDEYILGSSTTNTTIYDDRSALVPDFPIGISYPTGDTTVDISAGYTALEAALDTVGYDVSAANTVVADGVALSRYGYVDNYNPNGGHDGAVSAYDSTFFRGWIDEALSLITTSTPATATPSSQSTTAAPGTATVAVAQDRAVTVTAPGVTGSAATATTSIAQDRQVTTTSVSSTGAPGTASADVAQDRSTTTTAPEATSTGGTAQADVGQDRAVTAEAPQADAQPATTTIDVSQARSVTTSAAALSVAPGAATSDVAQDRSVTTDASALTAETGTATTAQSHEVTTTGPPVTVSLDGATTTYAQDRAITIDAPEVSTANGSPDIEAGADRTANISQAPSVAAGTGTATAEGTQSKTITTTAPTASLDIGGATAQTGADRTVTTEARTVAASTGTATVDAAQDRSVTSTAPSVTVSLDGATVSTAQSRELTVDAPGATGSTGTATAGLDDPYTDTYGEFYGPVSGDEEVTTTAPGATSSTGTPTPIASQSRSVTTTAPGAGLDNGTATTGIRIDKSITATAIQLAVAVGDAIADTGQGRSVTTTAPGLDFSTGTASTSIAASATTSAVTLTAQVGTATVTVSQARSITTVAPGVSVALGDARADDGSLSIYVGSNRADRIMLGTTQVTIEA